MPERTGGSRRKTRQKFSKDLKEKGKMSLRKFLQKFSQGDKVTLAIEPSYQRGLYHRRFHGKQGVVQAKQGECYMVDVKDGTIKKTFIVHPVHLKKA